MNLCNETFNTFSLISAASGPVRLFTPYKRRRKAQSEHNESMTGSGNGTTTVTITTPPISTTHNSSSSNLNNNTSIINNNQQTTQQLHIQTTPIQNNINNNSSHNNNNTVTINANNGIKKKRFSVNILNVKASGAESSDDVEAENITFAPAVTPSVKEEAVAPWQTVTEAIQEIPADYAVDQSCKFFRCFERDILIKSVNF